MDTFKVYETEFAKIVGPDRQN